MGNIGRMDELVPVPVPYFSPRIAEAKGVVLPILEDPQDDPKPAKKSRKNKTMVDPCPIEIPEYDDDIFNEDIIVAQAPPGARASDLLLKFCRLVGDDVCARTKSTNAFGDEMVVTESFETLLCHSQGRR